MRLLSRKAADIIHEEVRAQLNLPKPGGPFTHFVLSGELFRTDKSEAVEVKPAVGVELVIGEARNLGLQVKTHFAEVEASTDDIADNRLSIGHLILALKPTAFGLRVNSNKLDGSGEWAGMASFEIGRGKLGQSDELQPSAVTAADVLAVSLKTLSTLGELGIAPSLGDLEPEQRTA